MPKLTDLPPPTVDWPLVDPTSLAAYESVNIAQC